MSSSRAFLAVPSSPSTPDTPFSHFKHFPLLLEIREAVVVSPRFYHRSPLLLCLGRFGKQPV